MATSSQPPPPNTLVTLPDDVSLLILERVPCRLDRASMSLVCKAWRDMVARLSAMDDERRPLPWLLLPSHFDNDALFFRAACVLSGCCVHPRHNLLTTLPFSPGTRFAGAYDGAWIFLDNVQARWHKLFNIRTGQDRILPSTLVRRNPSPSVDNFVILAATLSSSPDDPSCIGAAIVVPLRDPDPYAVAMAAPLPLPPPCRLLMLWQMGWPVASEVVLGAGNLAAVYHVEDVVHHFEAFHALVNYRNHTHIVEFRSVELDDERDWEWINPDWHLFRPHESIYGHGFHRSRYIVASRGELLKVMRFKRHRDQATSMFKVFRATKRPQMPDADADFPVAAYPWEWSELDTLDGRMLFVGYGCSRSYEAATFPGFKAGIYFLDDGKFYEEAVLFRHHSFRPYPCSDNGKWSEGRAHTCFPMTDPSKHCPPVWYLP